MPRPHYFCHISLMLLSTAALAAQVQGTAPAPQPEAWAPADTVAGPEPQQA